MAPGGRKGTKRKPCKVLILVLRREKFGIQVERRELGIWVNGLNSS